MLRIQIKSEGAINALVQLAKFNGMSPTRYVIHLILKEAEAHASSKQKAI